MKNEKKYLDGNQDILNNYTNDSSLLKSSILKLDFDNLNNIVRCWDCKQVPRIVLDLEKNTILLKCDSSCQDKNINFTKFFDILKYYSTFNCCDFCQIQAPKNNYYLCKKCKNKILCDFCKQKHDKNHELINIKYDSTCKEHCTPYTCFCLTCKKNLCHYCLINHDENHENYICNFNKIIYKKNKLEEIENNIMNATYQKRNILKKIDLFIEELIKKINFLKELKENFEQKFRKKRFVVLLIYHNYLKKMKDLDFNYRIIKNMEEQINFGLPELVLNNNDSLDKKMEKFTNYVNNAIKSQFSINQKQAVQSFINPINKINIFSDIDYKFVQKYKEEIIEGCLDLNKSLFIIYTRSDIYFISKNNYQKKFELFDYIKSCKRINDNKIVFFDGFRITFLDIINNSDCKISNYIDIIDINADYEDEKYGLPDFKYSFFSINLDLILCDYYMDEIYIFSYPNYKSKIIDLKKMHKDVLFVDNILLFQFSNVDKKETHIYDIQKMKAVI